MSAGGLDSESTDFECRQPTHSGLFGPGREAPVTAPHNFENHRARSSQDQGAMRRFLAAYQQARDRSHLHHGGDSQALDGKGTKRMSKAWRICNTRGCPEVTTEGKCLKHRRQADKARGNSSQRGYGAQHQRTRTTLDIRVKAGLVDCARCGHRIKQGEPWALDHDDNDRGKYLGPSHAFCNNSAGGRKSHQS